MAHLGPAEKYLLFQLSFSND